MNEELAPLFSQSLGNKKVVGVVGKLQFDVLKYRLLNEYGAHVEFKSMPAFKTPWLGYDDKNDIAELLRFRSHSLYQDNDENLVFIADLICAQHGHGKQCKSHISIGH